MIGCGPFPGTVTGIVKLLDRCNNWCAFCSGTPEHAVVLPGPQVNAQVRRLRQYGMEELVLTGGEPTCHPDLVAAVGCAREAGYRSVMIFTNGRILTGKAYVRALVSAGLDSAMVSLHGPDAAIHEACVGVQGAFAETVSGVENLLAQGVQVTVNTVVSRLNYRKLEDLIVFLSRTFSNQLRVQMSDLYATARVAADPGLHVPYAELKPWLMRGLVAASCLSLPLCTSLFPLCVLDPFFMDALELRKKYQGYLIADDSSPGGVIWKRPDFDPHRLYLEICKCCSLRQACSGICVSRERVLGERACFRAFAHLDAGKCLAANLHRDPAAGSAGPVEEGTK